METTKGVKRQRTNDQNDLDDSMQLLLSDFRAKKNRSIDDLCEFMSSYIEKSEDFRRTVYEVQHQHNVLKERVDTLEAGSKVHQEKVEEHTDQIELVERDVREMQQSTRENEASLHRLEQKQLDTHVFITGFPVKPDEEEVLTSLTKLYGIPTESVDYKYSYEFKSKMKGPKASSTPGASNLSRKVFYQMVIAFKDQQMKNKFMMAKKEKGPINFEQLTRSKLQPKDASATIRCVNRLSKFNLMVQRELLTAKNEQKIFSFQLHNGIFRLKENDTAEWIMIGTQQSLQPFITERENN